MPARGAFPSQIRPPVNTPKNRGIESSENRNVNKTMTIVMLAADRERTESLLISWRTNRCVPASDGEAVAMGAAAGDAMPMDEISRCCGNCDCGCDGDCCAYCCEPPLMRGVVRCEPCREPSCEPPWLPDPRGGAKLPDEFGCGCTCCCEVSRRACRSRSCSCRVRGESRPLFPLSSSASESSAKLDAMRIGEDGDGGSCARDGVGGGPSLEIEAADEEEDVDADDDEEEDEGEARSAKKSGGWRDGCGFGCALSTDAIAGDGGCGCGCTLPPPSLPLRRRTASVADDGEGAVTDTLICARVGVKISCPPILMLPP